MALNQNIQMAPLPCDRADHQGRNIQGLCLREGCEIPPAQCYKCTLELHKECNASTKIIDEVPNLLEPLWSMKFELLQLQQQIILHISKLVASIEQMLKPISQYIETPNLTNLNNLGVFLKSQAQMQKLEQVILGICTQTKEIFNSIVEQENNLVIEDSSEKQFENKSALEWNEEGDELYNLQKYEEALECFEQALKINPNLSEAWSNKGATLLYQQKYEEALECYEQALNINPNLSEAWSNKGLTLNNLQKYEEALECYEQALNINPNLSEAWSNKGLTLNNLQKYEEALECYEQALNINPNLSEAWCNKGLTLNNLQKYEEALECYEQALNINPNYSEAWCNKGATLYNLQKYEEALECYEQALNINPNLSEAWSNKGFTLYNLQKYEEALECFESALNINPSHSIYQQNYNTLREQLNQ